MTRHAVVIGASLAGLCTARALAGSVDRVTVLDRDELPDGPVLRKGLPQAHHLHVLITAGQRGLDRLFPGLLDELYVAGAVRINAPTDVLYLTVTGWRERFPATHQLVGASRELIDGTVRARLRADDRVALRSGQEVTGLCADGTDITGVRLADGTELAADLVVDASGAGSRTPQWLSALGYPPPAESRLDSGLGYASRRYTVPAGAGRDWKNILLLPQLPHSTAGGVLFPIEGGRWVATLGGVGEQKPPTDEAGFLAYAKALPSPLIYDAIRDAEPASKVYGYHRTGNHRRHYEAMPHWPGNFLVVGDAACSFNPVYGQGMSVAAQTAVALARHLGAHGGRVDRAAQKVVAAAADTPWLIATGADQRLPHAAGPPPGLRDRLAHRYLFRVTDVANRDPYVCRVLNDVMHLVAPPSVLARPGVLLRTLRGRPGPRLDRPPPSTVDG